MRPHAHCASSSSRSRDGVVVPGLREGIAGGRGGGGGWWAERPPSTSPAAGVEMRPSVTNMSFSLVIEALSLKTCDNFCDNL